MLLILMAIIPDLWFHTLLSSLSPPLFSLEFIIFYIIAGVVGGVILVVVLILLVVLIAYCKKKISKRRGGKMSE